MYRIPQLLNRAAQQRPGHAATRMNDRVRSWAEVHDRVRRLAAAIRAAGAGTGDRVALLALNGDRYFETLFAIAWAGSVAVPVNTRLAAPEVEYILADCGPVLLFLDAAFQPMLPDLPAAAGMKALVCLDDGPVPAGQVAFEDLVAGHAPMAEAGAGDGDLAGIFYTGGTTGRSKGVMLTHDNLVTNAFNAVEGMRFDRHTNHLHAAPMFHLADGMCTYAVTAVGGTHSFIPRFTPQAALAAIERHRVTHSAMVPTMLNMIGQAPDAGSYDLSSLQQINFGASPMQEAVFRRLQALVPHARLLHGYGMTETAPLLTMLPPEYNTVDGPLAGRLASCGQACMGVELRIVDPDGREVPRGTIGEIAARGPNVMLGYWNKPEETAKVLREGWMHTGDGAWMDDEGFVFIVDRLKDMIISGGENVYSAEVESVISLMPGVGEVAVFGIPSAEWGEAVHATVVPRADASLTPEAVIAHCRASIAGYKCPRSVEIRQAALPLSGAGKVLKTVLRKPYWQDRGSSVA
ncbi:MAG: long-chain fatty acid--CoA ligase [Sneathiellaceae bacterium]